MPNCFSLTRKSDVAAGPVSLNQIDREMCEHFKVPVDEKEYHAYWYSIYGLGLACGCTFDEIIEKNTPLPKDEERLKAAKIHIQEVGIWLRDNFVVDTWYQGR